MVGRRAAGLRRLMCCGNATPVGQCGVDAPDRHGTDAIKYLVLRGLVLRSG